jgi:hypothetical protein
LDADCGKSGPKTVVCIQPPWGSAVSSLIEEVIGVLQAKVISHGDGEDQHQR